MTSESTLSPAPAAPQRRRPTIRSAQVVRIDDLGPRLRRVTFGGEAMAGFSEPRPGAHMKLFFGDLPADWRPEPGGVRPLARTYTPRRFDALRNELEVEFVMHGEGVASSWAAQVQVGDTLKLAGPGGGHDVSNEWKHVVLLVDETALPAAGMIIDALPEGCVVTLVGEVEDAQDELLPSQRPVHHLTWLHRAPTGAAPGALLQNMAQTLALTPDAQWFVACEATAMRAIKSALLTERGLNREQLISRGYWKLGATDHPDQDTGD